MSNLSLSELNTSNGFDLEEFAVHDFLERSFLSLVDCKVRDGAVAGKKRLSDKMKSSEVRLKTLQLNIYRCQNQWENLYKAPLDLVQKSSGSAHTVDTQYPIATFDLNKRKVFNEHISCTLPIMTKNKTHMTRDITVFRFLI